MASSIFGFNLCCCLENTRPDVEVVTMYNMGMNFTTNPEGDEERRVADTSEVEEVRRDTGDFGGLDCSFDAEATGIGLVAEGGEPVSKGIETPPVAEHDKVHDFQVTIDKHTSTRSLGIATLPKKTHVMVNCLRQGLIQMWNEANPTMQVKRGAVILSANQVSGDASRMYQALRTSEDLDMQVRYVEEFTIHTPPQTLGLDSSINKRNGGNKRETLGIEYQIVHQIATQAPADSEMSQGKGGAVGVGNTMLKRPLVKVTFIRFQGVIPEHNKTCKPGFEVISHDFIASVNGLRGEEAVAALKEGGAMTIVFRRSKLDDPQSLSSKDHSTLEGA